MIETDKTKSRRRFLRACLAFAAGTSLAGCRTLTDRDVMWLAEVQEQGQVTGSNALYPLLVDADGHPITTLSAWKKRKAEIRKAWLDYLGPLPPNPTPPVLEVLEEDRPGDVVRQLVAYESEPGMVVTGYLLKPANLRERVPGVLVLHSTVDHTIRQPAGVEGVPEKAFGLKLAQKGCVAFAPMCFLWYDRGERTYEAQVERFKERHPHSKGMAKMLFDAARGLDVLENLEMVDRNRIGAVGHSLGAKEVLYLAAFDERVKTAVSSEGGIGIDFSNWDAPWYLGPEIHSFGRKHHELLALIAPRPFLLVGGESADGERSRPFVEAALPVYDLFDKPRRMAFYNHQQGHAVPPEAEQRIYDWLLTYL